MTSRTDYWGVIFKHKGSATRAMRRMIGQEFEANFPGVSNRFETFLIMREDMISVTTCQGGFNICWKYTEDDLFVVIMGDSGQPKSVPYREVAHWKDATHPAIKTPRGIFQYEFDTAEEAKAAGYSLWFVASKFDRGPGVRAYLPGYAGTLIMTNSSNRAIAVRPSVTAQ
jgi:hypothetical protein